MNAKGARQLLLFNIVPIFLDIGIAIGLFVWKFDWTLALVIFFVMVAYGESFNCAEVVAYSL